MKKLIMLLLLSGVMPLSLLAQDDDMYFVPTKENKAKEARSYGMPSDTYYAGSSRSVDDYNRRVYSSVAPIDSAGNDIIDFSAVRGVYPDSTYSEVAADDYKLTRRMTRFDDYTPSQAYWDGYRDGLWASPWYYNSWYSWYDYDPWYWNNPYYYGSWYGYYGPWYYGYYRPWHYGYYGYYGPRWYGGHVRYARSGRPVNHRAGSLGGRSFGGYRGTMSNQGTSRNTNYGGSFSGSRGAGNSSSFGGSRSSSGGSFGGGHSSSGGSFGGGRSASGGRSFGGRK